MKTRNREPVSGVGGRGSGVRRRARCACRPAPRPLRRAAFTLVELLVVITIIIILIGLLTPVVIIALARAKEARIQTEISMLDGAFKAYKQKHDSYPPSDFTNLGTATYNGSTGVFDTTKLNTGSPQYFALANHLAKAFPRCNVNVEIAAIIVSNPTYTGGTRPPAPISPSQAVTFWLSGFCTDPEQPISGLIRGLAQEAPLVPFDRTRMSPPLGIAPVTMARSYCPADTPGVPYVYFAAQNYNSHASGTYNGPGDFNKVGSNGYPMTPYDTLVWGQGGTGIVRPYASDPVPPAATAPTPANASTFQIIAAGLDMDFGGGGVTEQGAKGNPVVAYFPSGTYYANGDKDNITNFSDKNLGDAIPK